MPLFRIEVEKTVLGTVLIEADDVEQAEEMADDGAIDLIAHYEWDEIMFDVDIRQMKNGTDLVGERYWSGGSDGEWKTVA